ncbi:hypothetical protein MLD38_034999 [Melastoma candidum]|uniref:Uncharacterized protein n=1 Tax=Melastoma candidum TaxID=119954 RepID=A0ACB9MC98_9MYRT|nr:hypothetical protein MLD38_034999 [Melastoma candidum]
MASVMGTANRIRRIVRMRQMLRNWRNKARFPSPSLSSSSSRRGGRAPPDVPAGHVAIYAGREGQCRRFVVRATHLNHPVFAKLLAEAEEEYGFGHDGPLTIPCEVSVFEDVIRFVSGSVREIGCGNAEEFRPLLRGLVQKPVW